MKLKPEGRLTLVKVPMRCVLTPYRLQHPCIIPTPTMPFTAISFYTFNTVGFLSFFWSQCSTHTEFCWKFPRHLIRVKPCHVDCRHHQALPDWVQPLRFHSQPDEISLDLETKARVIRPDKIASQLSASLCNIVCRLFTGRYIDTHLSTTFSPSIFYSPPRIHLWTIPKTLPSANLA